MVMKLNGFGSKLLFSLSLLPYDVNPAHITKGFEMKMVNGQWCNEVSHLELHPALNKAAL